MPVWRGLGVGALVAAAVTLGGGTLVGGGVAQAQATTCAGAAGLSAAQVTIDAPGQNETVSGTVTVRGSARAGLLGLLNRVEVTLGEVTRVQTFEPGTTLTYSVSVDASSLPAGNTPLKVAACGSLARGERSIAVNVAAPATTTTTARSTTTTGGGAGPGTTVAGAGAGAGVTTTSVATTTSTSTRVSTTEAAAPTTEAPPPATTTTAAPRRSAGRGTPLVLTETPPQSSSGPPVWVGAVVGVSGGLGLLVAARPWRRRGGRGGLGGGSVGAPVEDAEQLVR